MLDFDYLEKRLGIVASLCMIFQENYFSHYILSTDQVLLSKFLLPLLRQIWCNICLKDVN